MSGSILRASPATPSCAPSLGDSVVVLEEDIIARPSTTGTMALMLRSTKTAPSFLFWRKGSTKNEPSPPPLVIKVMNRSKSEKFYEQQSVEAVVSNQVCTKSDSEGLDELNTSALSQLNTTNDSESSGEKEDEREPFTGIEISEEEIAVDCTEAVIEAPFVQEEMRRRKESSVTVEEKHVHDPPQSQTVVDTNPSAEAGEAENTTPHSNRVPTNLEILEDLRSKLLAEKLKRRMATVVATGAGDKPEEPDDSLVKPPKKLPTKSFIEYRRDLFKCDEKYSETDPPGQLIPGSAPKDEDEPGKENLMDVPPEVLNEFPKAIIPEVPAGARKAEDVAMHEILTAINMLIAPAYETVTTESPASDAISKEPTNEDAESVAVSDVCMAEPSPSPTDISSDESEADMDKDGQQSSGVSGNVKPVSKGSPTAVHDFLRSDSAPTRSRSTNAMDAMLRNDCPQDESPIRGTAGYATLSTSPSHDESSPIKRCGSDGALLKNKKDKPTPMKEYGRSVRFRFNESPVIVRKINFEDHESKDGEAEDDYDSAYEEREHVDRKHHRRGKYEEVKDEKDLLPSTSGKGGPSMATNLHDIWYDCAYLCDVVSEEFWSGLLGEDDLDIASINASVMDSSQMDNTSLDGSVADSLFTEDNEEDEQYAKDKQRQKLWRSYRRKLQLARKETDV